MYTSDILIAMVTIFVGLFFLVGLFGVFGLALAIVILFPAIFIFALL